MLQFLSCIHHSIHWKTYYRLVYKWPFIKINWITYEPPKLASKYALFLLAINLLKKYGGIWVDATTFCTTPLNSWILKQKTFFAFSSPGKDRMISSWFMTNVYKNSFIINKFCDDVNSYWEVMISKNQYKAKQYFQFHYIFNKLYKKYKLCLSVSLTTTNFKNKIFIS